ncbi:MAG: PDZ domain-containing protein, partial [Ignavibacteriales bacterium]|nr:PDZ domain-containing protein [Ignavibacteriales bacterium]
MKKFPAALLRGGNQAGEFVQVGDLLVSMGQRSLASGTENDIQQVLEESADTTVIMSVLRLSTGETLRYRVDKGYIPAGFFRRLGPTARVIAVTPGGASDRAGMQIGDLIIRINGRRFADVTDADRVMRMGGVGKSIAYEVLRNKENLTLNVTLAAFGVQFGTLIVTLSGVLFMCTGVFLGLARPRFTAARLSALSFALLGFAIMVALNRRVASDEIITVILNGTFAVSAFFAIPITFHSGMYFPKERQELLAKKWIRIVPYGIATVFFALTALVKNDVSFIVGIIFNLGYMIVIHLLYRKRATEEYRKLNRVGKLTGIFVGVSAFALGAYIQSTQNPQLLWIFGILLTLIPAAHLYTIGRYRLLDMDLRVRRNVQYTFVTTLWTLALVLVTLKALLMLPTLHLPTPNIRFTSTSIEVLDVPLDPQAQQVVEKGILMFVAIGLSLIALKTGRKGQQFIDKKFYRSQYDYRRAASELAEVMATKLTMTDLARGMVEKLTELIHLKRAGVLFFRGQKECCCQEAQGFEGGAWKEYCLATSEDLVKAIQQFQGEFSVDYLPAGMKEQFRKSEFLYIVPIRSKDTLVGAILVGEKLSE